MPAADLDSILPHRAPMRWINALTDCTETTAAATACFTPDHFSVADGKVPETALIECVAKTAAAALGQRARMLGPSVRPSVGMLTAVSEFCFESAPPLGKQLRIEVRELRRLGPMLRISGSVTCDGERIASGELTLYA